LTEPAVSSGVQAGRASLRERNDAFQLAHPGRPIAPAAEAGGPLVRLLAGNGVGIGR